MSTAESTWKFRFFESGSGQSLTLCFGYARGPRDGGWAPGISRWLAGRETGHQGSLAKGRMSTRIEIVWRSDSHEKSPGVIPGLAFHWS